MIVRGRSFSLLGLIVTALIAVPSFALVLQRAGSQDGPRERLALTSASGAVAITNSREGAAVLSADPMLPGDQTTGTVRIANTGEGSERLVLDSSDPVDRPGPGGGLLSSRLRLRIEDVTTDGLPTAVYDGTLTGLHGLALGTFGAGEARLYRFVVTFPDGGGDGADNAFQGSAASIGFNWTTSEGPTTPPAGASYEDQLAADAPQAYWPLDGSTSSMQDAAGASDGAYSNGVTTSPDAAPGGGAAAFFDGVSAYGSVSSVAAPRSAYTIEAWVRPAVSGDMAIAEHGAGGTLAIVDGRFVFRAVDREIRSSAPVEIGRWQQVVATWDAGSGTGRIYVDGQETGSGDAPTAPSGAATFYVGRSDAYPGLFHGSLAKVSYFTSALAPDRIAAHYSAGAATPAASSGDTPSSGGDAGSPGSADPGTGGGSADQPSIEKCPARVSAQGAADRAAIARARARVNADIKVVSVLKARAVAKHGAARARAKRQLRARKRSLAKDRARLDALLSQQRRSRACARASH